MSESKLKAQCNKCLGETNHILLHREEQSWGEVVDRDNYINGSDIFNMVKCCGCDSVKLMHISWFSEITDEYGRPIDDTNYYPPAISKAEPKWLLEMGDLFGTNESQYISSLLREIYSALHNDSRRLAVMGIRALIEYVMINKVGDNKTFKNNLNKFQQEGYLSEKQRELIEPILEAGHAAIHRGYEPSSKDVLTVIEISEGLIETLFVHSKKANELEKRVPKRIHESTQKKIITVE